ncbi:MAG: hypothetical protein A2096_04005 [Spirochaetes bacterium GWF1_41_5]|nr:MAG: hypothetical protein A2096_04005 [Spirochaetes bacterium GWF1_41_5]HBE01980.1 hypothetical protein [Spirochaetia bacterium]
MNTQKKYSSIAAQLEKKIAACEFQEYLPSVKKLTSEYKTTQRTISRACNLLTQKKLIYYEKGLGNRIVISGAEKKKEKTNLRLAVFTPFQYSRPRSMKIGYSIFTSIIQECRNFGSSVEVFDSLNISRAVKEILNLRKRRDLDGIFFCKAGSVLNENIRNALRRIDVPVIITIHALPFDQEFSTVGFSIPDIFTKFRKNINSGLPIYFFSFDIFDSVYNWACEREKAFSREFPSGVIFKKEKIETESDATPQYIRKIGYTTANYFFDKLSFPCTIIGVNDCMVKGICDYLIKRKIQIPGQVFLIGIDNFPKYTKGLISSINLSYAGIGRQMVRLMHKQYDELSGKKPLKISIPVKFIHGISS